MPVPFQDFLSTPVLAPVQLGLEPAFNAIHSLLLLTRVEETSGFGEWVQHTYDLMSVEERQQHELVMIGLHYAVLPRQSWVTFPAYIDRLESMPAQALRDKMMDVYLNIATCAKPDQPAPRIGPVQALESSRAYLDFLYERFDTELIDEDLETRAYAYVVNPPEMQALIVRHLRQMWQRYLHTEWKRIKPMLQDSINAFQQIDFTSMDKLEAARQITGQVSDNPDWVEKIQQAERIIFIPNAHVGPYLGKYQIGNALGIIFGARLPGGVQIEAPDLSRNEILVRLSALADDTRLRILRLVLESGELRSQDIMERLGLSQSASSRHLQQLSATGYLRERRCEGAKCYQLNPDRIEDTLNATGRFLLEA